MLPISFYFQDFFLIIFRKKDFDLWTSRDWIRSVRSCPAVSGHDRSCLAVSGRVPPCPAVSGRLQPCPVVSGRVQPCPAVSGPSSPSPPCPAVSGRDRPCPAVSGRVQPCAGWLWLPSQQQTLSQQDDSHSWLDGGQKQFERGSHIDFHTMHVHPLKWHIQRTPWCNWCSCGSQKSPSTGWTRFIFARPRVACSSRIHQKLDVVRLFLILTDLSKHHDPVWLIIDVRQAMYTTSTTGTRIACFILLRTLACKVTDLATVIASTFLLGVTILGFCVFPLTFLAFLAFLAFLSFLIGVGPDQVVLAMATARTSAAISAVHSRVQEQMYTQRGIWQVM